MRNRIESALLKGAPNPAPRLIEIVGPHPGPCVALLGGIHGDEDEGVLSVRRIVAMLRDRPIARLRISGVKPWPRSPTV